VNVIIACSGVYLSEKEVGDGDDDNGYLILLEPSKLTLQYFYGAGLGTCL
jgi:hypothetical protein